MSNDPRLLDDEAPPEPPEGTLPEEPDVEDPGLPGDEIPDVVDPDPPTEETDTIFYAVFLPTGQITQTGKCHQEDADDQVEDPGEVALWPLVEAADANVHMVNTSTLEIEDRPLLDVLTPTPAPFSVSMVNTDHIRVVNEGVYEVETDDPLDPVIITEEGFYTIYRTATWPYQDETMNNFFVPGA